jgi:hypothetical protein
MSFSITQEVTFSHFQSYCLKNKITFTKSRAYKKNNSCYVDQSHHEVMKILLSRFRAATRNP